jgi:hypothetical protein
MTTTHQCPVGDSNMTLCCARTPFELPSTDRMTTTLELVTCGRSATTTHREARTAALDVLTKVAGFLRPDMDADLSIDAVNHGIRVRLDTEDPAAAREIGEIMHLTAEPPAPTPDNVHHVWSGVWREHPVRVSVLTPIGTSGADQ